MKSSILNKGVVEHFKRNYNYKLEGWQIEATTDVLYSGKKRFMVKAPRGGRKSTWADIMAIDFAVRQGKFVLITSVGGAQAQEHIAHIRRRIQDTVYDILRTEPDNTEEINFKNGGRILSIPQGITTRVGYHPDVKIIDEASRIDNEFYYSVVSPMGAGKHPYEIIISTPYINGMSGFFWEMFTGDNDYVKYDVQIEECPWLDEEYIEEQRQKMPQVLFEVEILGKFRPTSLRVFNEQALRDAVSHPEGHPKDDHIYSMGVDFGKEVDYTAVVILDVTEDIPEVVHAEHFKMAWEDTFNRIRALYDAYHITSLLVDATGIGNVIISELEDLSPKPFVFTNKSKVDVINNLIVKLEQRKLKIGDNRELFEEMDMYQYKEGDMTKMNAPAGMHDDYVIALALALRASSGAVTIIGKEDEWNEFFDSGYWSNIKAE